MSNTIKNMEIVFRKRVFAWLNFEIYKDNKII